MKPAIPPFAADRYLTKLNSFHALRSTGKVSQIIGLTIEGDGPAVDLGEHCYIKIHGLKRPLSAEVVGFKEDKTLLMPLGEMRGIGSGCEIGESIAPSHVIVGPVAGWSDHASRWYRSARCR